MNAVAEAASLLRRVAEPRPVGDTIKAAINRAARRVSRHLPHPMRPSRAEDIWRAEARAIRSEEMDAIPRIEALLVQDAEFHGHQVDALCTLARRQDRPVDRGDGE